ncbi:MAG: class I SAM-dependent methyltransferase [Candidatus Paceibacterota bacterium]
MKTKSPFQYRVFRSLYKKAAFAMCKECSNFIDLKSKILDFGCGSGTIGNEFKNYFQADILGIDIIDNRVEDIPFKKYDGNDIAFLSDNSFDVVLINYVLHHTPDPVKALEQACSKSKKRIIIYENLPEGFFSKIFCRLHGISFGVIFQKNFISGKFLTEKEWQRAFQDLNLKLIYAKTKPGLSLMKTKLFVLEKGV